ncbi:MAG: hypothetical protein QOE77_1074 [Blastocatellia bacterium]|jgi:hypothetical protein|nr:hypothetical protein [Blastocatellia bacterium]
MEANAAPPPHSAERLAFPESVEGFEALPRQWRRSPPFEKGETVRLSLTALCGVDPRTNLKLDH